MTERTQTRDEVDAVVAAATAGDEAAFSELADRYRHELEVHSRRMLGSSEDAEDAVQETFLRAWRSRASFRGDSTFRAWLYRIATNTCLDELRRGSRRTHVAEAPEATWMQPDRERPVEVATPDPEPDAVVVAKETIEVAFRVAIQHLPPRQRAVLILRGVIGLSAKDAASLLDASVASVNSALQRARRTLNDRLPEQRLEWSRRSDASEEERALLERYVEATERADGDAFVEMLCEKARATRSSFTPNREGDEAWL